MPTFASFGEILKSAASPTGKDMPKRCGKISEILRACWVDSELSDNIPDIPKIDLAAVAPTNQTNGIWKATGAFDGFRFTLEKIPPRFWVFSHFFLVYASSRIVDASFYPVILQIPRVDGRRDSVSSRTMLRYAAMMRGLHRFPMLSASWDLEYQNACCNKAFCSTVWPRSWCTVTAVCSEEKGEGNFNAASEAICGKTQLDGINIDMAASDWQTASLYIIWYICITYIKTQELFVEIPKDRNEIIPFSRW